MQVAKSVWLNRPVGNDFKDIANSLFPRGKGLKIIDSLYKWLWVEIILSGYTFAVVVRGLNHLLMLGLAVVADKKKGENPLVFF